MTSKNMQDIIDKDLKADDLQKFVTDKNIQVKTGNTKIEGFDKQKLI